MGGDSVAPLFPDRFQGGIIIAVDSRASMGSYIGSQTVKKAGSLDSSARKLTKMEIYEIYTTGDKAYARLWVLKFEGITMQLL